MATLEELQERRAYELRLTPDRALRDLDEAAAWIHERGVATLMPCCSLPSFFAACHEEPYAPGKGGFAQWPKTKWWWPGRLADRPEYRIHFLKIHAGKGVLASHEVARLCDPLAREAIARADGDQALLLEHLVQTGPSALDEVKEELGWDAKRLKRARDPLERVAALVTRGLVVEASAGRHRHTSKLYRWEQAFPDAAGGGLALLLEAFAAAAVVAPERETRRWLSWRVAELPPTLERPEPGWVAAPASA